MNRQSKNTNRKWTDGLEQLMICIWVKKSIQIDHSIRTMTMIEWIRRESNLHGLSNVSRIGFFFFFFGEHKRFLLYECFNACRSFGIFETICFFFFEFGCFFVSLFQTMMFFFFFVYLRRTLKHRSVNNLCTTYRALHS